MRHIILIIVSLYFSNIHADTSEDIVSCIIDSSQAVFTHSTHAVYSPKEGLSIWAMERNGESISIRIPDLKCDTFSIENSPDLYLRYSTSLFSSNSRSYFNASKSHKNTEIKVVLIECGKVGEKIKGTFEATVSNFPDKKLIKISSGFFSVTRVAAKVKD